VRGKCQEEMTGGVGESGNWAWLLFIASSFGWGKEKGAEFHKHSKVWEKVKEKENTKEMNTGGGGDGISYRGVSLPRTTIPTTIVWNGKKEWKR